MIYDCFTFFNELEILELRLQLLYDVVDKFVLVESTKTHSNVNKELFYESNKKRYAKYQDKIIHIVVSEFPEFKNSWTFENYQRNQIYKAIKNCRHEDIIMISDVDEIPKPDVIKQHSFDDEIYRLVQDQYYFYFNYRDLSHLFWIGGTVVLKFKVIKNNLLNENKVHYNDISFPKYLNTKTTPTKARLYDGCKFIYNGGWHFTYFGGIDAIFTKIKAFSHQELNNEYFLDSERIENCLLTGRDVFERSNHRFVRVKISASTHPEILCKISETSPLIYTKSRVKEIPFYYKLSQISKIRIKRFIKNYFYFLIFRK